MAVAAGMDDRPWVHDTGEVHGPQDQFDSECDGRNGKPGIEAADGGLIGRPELFKPCVQPPAFERSRPKKRRRNSVGGQQCSGPTPQLILRGLC